MIMYLINAIIFPKYILARVQTTYYLHQQWFLTFIIINYEIRLNWNSCIFLWFDIIQKWWYTISVQQQDFMLIYQKYMGLSKYRSIYLWEIWK